MKLILLDLMMPVMDGPEAAGGHSLAVVGSGSAVQRLPHRKPCQKNSPATPSRASCKALRSPPDLLKALSASAWACDFPASKYCNQKSRVMGERQRRLLCHGPRALRVAPELCSLHSGGLVMSPFRRLWIVSEHIRAQFHRFRPGTEETGSARAAEAGTTARGATARGLPTGAVAKLGQARLRHAAQANCVVFAPDSKTFTTSGARSGDGTIRIRGQSKPASRSTCFRSRK